MMENKNFLRHLFTEDIYVIDSEGSSGDLKPETDTSKSTPKEYSANDEKLEVSGFEEQEVNEQQVNDQKEPPIKKLKLKGDESGTLLIYNFDKKNEFISQGDELFLQNVLKAINVNITDAVLINSAKETTDLKAILKQLSSVETILAFGTDSLQYEGELYTVNSLENSRLLLCDTLSAIEQDKTKKKALWTALQNLFLK